MGTRNLTIIKVDNEIKVAKYCQWDGYPTGQGKSIAEFIQNGLDLKKLKANVRKIQNAEIDHIKKCWANIGVKSDMVTMKQSDKFKRRYPQFHRDIGGGDILKLIQNGEITLEKISFKNDKMVTKVNRLKNIEITHLINDYGFFTDSLFCEYSYLIDLDNKKISVYHNGNNLLKTYTFKSFTENAMKKLENSLKQ